MREAAIQMMIAVESTMAHWNPELARIDPDLSLIRAKHGAQAPGLKPGFWHLMRSTPGAPINLIPLEGPGGEFREPGSWMFDMIRSSDLWDGRVTRDRERKLAAAEDAKRRARLAEREARQGEILERWQAASRAQVSMNRDTPWSQSHAGKRGAGKKAARWR